MDSIGHTACRLVTSALALVTAFGALSAQAQKFSVTILEALPDSVSVEGVAINNSGQVAGNSIDANGVSFAILWNGTTPTVLEGRDQPEDDAFVSGMNNLGVVVGYDVGGLTKDFAAAWGVPFSCDGQGEVPWSTASAINDAGQIVGTQGGDIPPVGVAIIWSNSCITNGSENLEFGSGGLVFPTTLAGTAASSINNMGEAVGVVFLSFDPNGPQHAARWNPHLRDMGTLGGKSSGANQINDRGFVVGWADIPNNTSHAALWGPHTIASDLGTLGGKTSSANGINAQGDAVGSSQTRYWRALPICTAIEETRRDAWESRVLLLVGRSRIRSVRSSFGAAKSARASSWIG